MPWVEPGRMVSAYEVRASQGRPPWLLYSYRSVEQYERKLRWYAVTLAQLSEVGSILDVGCGTGGLLDWWTPVDIYHGIDLVPAFVDTARSRFPERRFECGDVLTAEVERMDTVVMIGLLGLSPAPIELIDRASDLSASNLLFDFLPTTAGRVPTDQLRRLPSEVVSGRLAEAGLEIVRADPLGSTLAVWATRCPTDDTAPS